MKYTQLTQQYMDDTLAEAMYAREVEFFHYDFDRVNFIEILRDMPIGEFRTNTEARLACTIEQMNLVERIYNALQSQITNKIAFDEAVHRTTTRRAIRESKNNNIQTDSTPQ